MIALPAGTHIWVACGVTDMRKGFDSLAMVAQEVVKQSPRSGHVFVFRGRRVARCTMATLIDITAPTRWFWPTRSPSKPRPDRGVGAHRSGRW